MVRARTTLPSNALGAMLVLGMVTCDNDGEAVEISFVHTNSVPNCWECYWDFLFQTTT